MGTKSAWHRLGNDGNGPFNRRLHPDLAVGISDSCAKGVPPFARAVVLVPFPDRRRRSCPFLSGHKKTPGAKPGACFNVLETYLSDAKLNP